MDELMDGVGVWKDEMLNGWIHWVGIWMDEQIG
jgi:hypothetical protein